MKTEKLETEIERIATVLHELIHCGHEGEGDRAIHLCVHQLLRLGKQLMGIRAFARWELIQPGEPVNIVHSRIASWDADNAGYYATLMVREAVH